MDTLPLIATLQNRLKKIKQSALKQRLRKRLPWVYLITMSRVRRTQPIGNSHRPYYTQPIIFQYSPVYAKDGPKAILKAVKEIYGEEVDITLEDDEPLQGLTLNPPQPKQAKQEEECLVLISD